MPGEVSDGLAASWPCKPVRSLGVCYGFPLIQSGNSCDLRSPHLNRTQRFTSDLLTMISVWQSMLICYFIMIVSFH